MRAICLCTIFAVQLRSEAPTWILHFAIVLIVGARLERLRSLYTERPQDRIFARMEVETNALRKFAAKYPPGYTDCPDLRAARGVLG